MNEKIEERILEAMARLEPKEPRCFELGGDDYYRCHWMDCDETVNRFMNFCPRCGQKIDWEGVER